MIFILDELWHLVIMIFIMVIILAFYRSTPRVLLKMDGDLAFL